MSRWTLTAVLLMPVLIVGGLGVYAFGHARTQREVNRRAEIAARAELAAARAEAERAAATHATSIAPSDAGAPVAEPRMVRPETLAQGFVILVKDNGGLASADSPIYLASNQTGWDPGVASQRLTPRSDGRWQIVISKMKNDAPLDFKFTRGNWDKVEIADDLADISNRSLPLVDASKLGPNEQPVLEFVVAKWADQRPAGGGRPDLDPYYALDVTGTARRVQVSGGGVALGTGWRDVIVWLPPGYDDAKNAATRYPVLYLQDGQNVFQKMPQIPAEWGADETATRLIEAGKVEPLIIVAIPHAGKGRMSEYLPFEAIDGVTPRGVAYAQWLVREVVPRIDRQFRTKADAAHRAVGGSSLGAVISLHAATAHPGVFGKVLCESMSFVQSEGASSRHFAAVSAGTGGGWPERVYFGMGGKEAGSDPAKAGVNAAYAEGARSFASGVLERAMPGPGRVKFVLDEAAEHSEVAWAARFGAALEFLFPASGAGK